MHKKICILVSLVLLASISCAQAKREETKVEEIKVDEIKTRAEEANTALISGDYQRFVDLTYPKLVEQMGGRAKMISALEQQMGEAKAQGIEMAFTSFDAPKEVVPIGTQFFAIVPYTLKMKSPEGVLTQQSYLLAISNKNNLKWTFLDVTNFNEAQLKVLVPNAIGKLTFPQKQQPFFEPNP